MLLRSAASWQDWDLADAVWRRLPSAMGSNTAVIGDYVNRLLNAGQGLTAARVWGKAAVNFAPGSISNGGFARLLQQRSLFDWRLRIPEGAVIERDTKEFVSAPAALRLHFDGKQNLRLDSPEQYVAVVPGHSYRLSGMWMARGLTTRALPYWQVIGYGPSRHYVQLGRINAAGNSDWPWQAFSVVLTIPDEVEVLRIRLRRDPTGDFDRNIAGDLWLDDVRMSEE